MAQGPFYVGLSKPVDSVKNSPNSLLLVVDATFYKVVLAHLGNRILTKVEEEINSLKKNKFWIPVSSLVLVGESSANKVTTQNKIIIKKIQQYFKNKIKIMQMSSELPDKKPTENVCLELKISVHKQKASNWKHFKRISIKKKVLKSCRCFAEIYRKQSLLACNPV